MNNTINITFDNSINFNGYFVNGLIYSYDNEITIKINPDSKENILFILIHELTHLLDLKYLKELFIDYITNELEVNAIDNQISDELICDIAGLLFSNKIIITNNFITNFKSLWKYLILNNKIILTNEVNYKLIDDKKYGRYWVVEDSKDIFKGLSKSKIKVAAYNYIINGNKNYINIKDTIDNTTINFSRISAREYTMGTNSKKLIRKDYCNKMRISASIDDLINNSLLKYKSPLVHTNKLFKKGFNNFQGKVKIDQKFYRYIIRIGISKNSNIFYDISLFVEK